MRKMIAERMLIVAACIIFFCFAGLAAQTAPKLKEYNNTRYNFSFLYPETWQLDGSTDRFYIALFNQEAAADQEESLYLLHGLKVEFYLNETDKEIENYKKDFKKLENGSIWPQYLLELNNAHGSAYCLLIMTLIKAKYGNIRIIGYIPEKDKQDKYLQEYQQVLGTLKFK